IYGIKEKKDKESKNTGEPEKIIGINIDNQDKLFQQIEDTIRTNTDPAITSIIPYVVVVENKKVLIIGIPKGLGLPSMTTFNNSNKFYRRKNTGKYLVDVNELNDMFMKNQVLKEKAQLYRKERIEKILSKESFPNLDTSRFCVVHIIPFSFLNENFIDLSKVHYDNDLRKLIIPMVYYSLKQEYNIYGYVGYDEHKHNNYTQIIRNGVVELYSAISTYRPSNQNYPDCTYGTEIYNMIFKNISKGLEIIKRFNVEEPFLISVYFHNMENLNFSIDNHNVHIINCPKIPLPFITLPTYDSDLKLALKPLFDILWQCANFNECNINE
ncbi:MAG: hypothetical protein LBM25_07175, partial [Bacteroidales bacterium]|nr:hypothetical protein [Bacteroidales bacterium]